MSIAYFRVFPSRIIFYVREPVVVTKSCYHLQATAAARAASSRRLQKLSARSKRPPANSGHIVETERASPPSPRTDDGCPLLRRSADGRPARALGFSRVPSACERARLGVCESRRVVRPHERGVEKRGAHLRRKRKADICFKIRRKEERGETHDPPEKFSRTVRAYTRGHTRSGKATRSTEKERLLPGGSHQDQSSRDCRREITAIEICLRPTSIGAAEQRYPAIS